MSWDDDFDAPTGSAGGAASAAVDDWEFEAGAGDDDDALLESWDVDSDEEREKAAKAKEEAELKKKLQREKMEAKKNPKKSKTLMEIDLVDEKTRQEMLKQMEMDADLNNAADLFDGLGLNDHPRSRATANNNGGGALKLTVDTPLSAHPLFSPSSKQDYEKLRKKLAETLLGISSKSTLFYANSLAVDLVRDVCGPLTIEQTRKAISTLNSLVAQKVKEERANRMKKTGGTSTGGAGKKKAKAGNVNTGPANFTKDNFEDYVGGDDGLDDDDFM